MSAMVLMPNGRNVNLCTNRGAMEFFAASPNFVSAWTGQAKEIMASEIVGGRRSSSTPGAANLITMYQMLGVMAESLRPEQLATLAQDEFQCLVDFIKMRFSTVSDTASWRSSGTLSKPDQELLDTVVPWLKHPMFVELMLHSDGLAVIANLVARDENGKPAMPIPEVTETILMITNNTILTVDGSKSDSELSAISIPPKDVLLVLERTGLLAQALRCLTVPVRHDSIEKYLRIIDFIEKDTRLLKRKFVPGHKTGDILEGLLSGKDGWKRKSNRDYDLVMKRLAGLHKLAVMTTQNDWLPEDDSELSRICRNCGKSGLDLKKEDESKRLLACSKCKCTFYCNRECQRADWKEHKKSCDPFRAKLPTQNIVMSFIREHYIAIMTKIKEVCVENGIEKKDVVLQVDFYGAGGEKGLSPGMEGKFNVEPVKRCLDGDRSAEPDWFYKGTEVYESNVAFFRTGLQDQQKRMTPNHVLASFRGNDGNTGVYRVDIVSESTGFHIMSNEALELFPQDTLEKQMRLQMLQGGSRPTAGQSDQAYNKFL